mmetsp:Transcript_2105/g.5165  ORF Transcript_2105/g.5165 Transcript_2105/m.5165 type:complete len:246 (-) Transcript_2105:39-776(-)
MLLHDPLRQSGRGVAKGPVPCKLGLARWRQLGAAVLRGAGRASNIVHVVGREAATLFEEGRQHEGRGFSLAVVASAPAQATGEGLRFDGIVATQCRIAARDHCGQGPDASFSSGEAEVSADLLRASGRLGGGQSSCVGEHIEAGPVHGDGWDELVSAPVGKDRHGVHRLRARRVVVHNGQWRVPVRPARQGGAPQLQDPLVFVPERGQGRLELGDAAEDGWLARRLRLLRRGLCGCLHCVEKRWW